MGDLRLANADTLARRLGTEPGGDVDLVLRAYDRWGPDAGERLEGHYAFALWDPKRRLLWAARDLFGVKPLFHRHVAGALLIADTIEALLDAPGGRPPPDEAWVAEFLAGQRMSAARTPFAGIERLPPGCALIAEDGRPPRIVRQRSLWPLAGPRVPAGEAPDALREALDAAVARAMAAPAGGTVGAMLSGGLDSGSLASLATRHVVPLRTYSMVFPGHPSLDERPWIDAVLGEGRCAPAFVELGVRSEPPPSGLDLASREHPADGYGHGRLDRLLARAAADGVEALLDGHGGDEVIGSGVGRLDELAAERRVVALWQAASGVAPLAGASRIRLFLAAMASSAPDRATRAVAGRLGGRPPEDRRAWRRMVRPDLAGRTGLVDRARALATPPAGATAEEGRHLATLNPVLFADSLESLARLARPHGIEPRYPFLDERVVAICLAQPACEKLRGREARSLLRRAMAGVLPDTVRLRATKTDFLPLLAEELSEDRDGRLTALLCPGTARAREVRDRTATYVDLVALGEVVEGLASRPNVRDCTQAWRVLSLTGWLGQLDGPARRDRAA